MVPMPQSANVSVVKDTKLGMIDERSREVMDQWMATRPLGAQAGRILSMQVPPLWKEQRNKELEAGIIAIIDREPHSKSRTELIDMVDPAQAGKSVPEI